MAKRQKTAVRPATHTLFTALLLDVWPDSPSSTTDFGIASQEHYAALQAAVASGAISEERLDELLGDGPGLTKACGGSVIFSTPWDAMRER